MARTSVQKLIDRPHVLAPRRPLRAGPAHRQLSAAGTALRRLVQATSELPGRAGVSSRGLGQIWAGPMVLARRPSFQQCLPLKKKIYQSNAAPNDAMWPTCRYSYSRPLHKPDPLVRSLPPTKFETLARFRQGQPAARHRHAPPASPCKRCEFKWV